MFLVTRTVTRPALTTAFYTTSTSYNTHLVAEYFNTGKCVLHDIPPPDPTKLINVTKVFWLDRPTWESYMADPIVSVMMTAREAYYAANNITEVIKTSNVRTINPQTL